MKTAGEMSARQHRYLSELLTCKFHRAPRAYQAEEQACQKVGWIAWLSEVPEGGTVPWRDLLKQWTATGRAGKFPKNRVVGFYVTDEGRAALAASPHDWIETKSKPS